MPFLKNQSCISCIGRRFYAVFSTAILVALVVSGSQALHAQTYTVLHNFTGGSDGGNPYAGLTLDRGGNLYGTAAAEGNGGCCGVVYKLQRRGAGWTLAPLHSFTGPDGAGPEARVVFGPDGALYGTTTGGGGNSAGTVFKLQPPSHACASVSCPWKETLLHSFGSYNDGIYPAFGDVVFDSSGNLYGATPLGGNTTPICADDETCGAVYTVFKSNGAWLEKVIYSFQGGDDGAFPNAVTFDSSGNLVGTTSFRGANIEGTVFSLKSDGHGGWSETSLYSFSGGADGGAPAAGVTPDGSGGFFGTTSYGGSGNGGTVWQLSPSGGNWLLNTLNSFKTSWTSGLPLPGPASVLTMDAAGNLYGTTVLDGAFNQGSVFKLTHSNGGWILTTLHDFTGGADGGEPFGQVIVDASGNIFGTATIGGPSVGNCDQGLGCGVVFEITQ